MSIHATNWARDICVRLDVPTKHRLVLFVISMHHHHKTGACFPSYDTIARESGYHRRGVIDTVKELEANGLLTKQVRRVSGRQGSNNYQLFGRSVAKKWISTRVQKKAPCESADASTLTSVRTGAPDRDYNSKGEISAGEHTDSIVPFGAQIGGSSYE